MATRTLPDTLAPFHLGPLPPQAPAMKVWSVDQFHALGDLGVFENRGASLISGVIFEEGPMNPLHAVAGEKSEAAIQAAFGPGWRMRVEKPLVLGQTTDPKPDIAVIRGVPALGPDPTTADLVVEISDTSFRYDTTEKLTLYASARVAEYWVLDVNGRHLHVFRDPAGDAYTTHRTLGEADTISPLATPTATARVADLLP